MRYPNWNGALPRVPDGVILREAPEDHGPATKFVERLAEQPDTPTLICDDDVIYDENWLAGFTEAANNLKDHVIAASGFSPRRIGLKNADGSDLIVQGFAGVWIPNGISVPKTITERDRYADDIWLSAQLAISGKAISLEPAMRAHCQPFAHADALQDFEVDGHARAEIYRRSAVGLAKEFGIWGETTNEI